MPEICPTITAEKETDYKDQVEKIAGFAHRIQIDLSDGQFAPRRLVEPRKAWWPVGIKADIHLMFKDPSAAVKVVISHKPHLIIVHAEAAGNFEDFGNRCRANGIKVGVALLPQTQADVILPALPHIDHVLIFSGNLGFQGGSRANLALLEKARYLKEHKRTLEIGWDGGINDQNVSQLIFGGVDVLNVGGFIQKSDNPERAYESLKRIADETGTT